MSGKGRDKAKMTPEVISAIKNIEAVEILQALLKGQKNMIPVGVVHNPGPYTVTYSAPARVECLPTPWFSFTLFNDGPDSVWVTVEAPPNADIGTLPLTPHEVKAGEPYTVDMHAPLIRSVYLTADAGASATVRISGVR